MCAAPRRRRAHRRGLNSRAPLSLPHPQLQARLKRLRTEFGGRSLGEVTVEQAVGGMRGIPGMLWETSLLDAEEGIRFRGHSIPELQAKLPGAHAGGQPLPEGLLWLLMTGQLPTREQAAAVSRDLAARAALPPYVTRVLDSLPRDAHPMTQLAAGVLALQPESQFAKAYERGVHKSKYWEPIFEDSLNLIARLPAVAARIYRRAYCGGTHVEADPSLDWAANLAHMVRRRRRRRDGDGGGCDGGGRRTAGGG